MTILAHKTGINKTAGEQEGAIVVSTADGSLQGNWIPGTGVNTHYWANQVGGESANLRRFNSVATGSSPSHWIFSGTNDYFGQSSSGYGGSSVFGVNTGAEFTLAQWFKNDSGVKHVAFSLVYGGGNILKLIISDSTDNKARLTVGSETPVEFNYTFADDTWYYISLVYHGSNVYTFFVNGSFVGTANITSSGVDPAELQIGRDASTSTYSGSTIKLGHVHVYNDALANSQLRQNFLATHSIHNTRVFGATYTA